MLSIHEGLLAITIMLCLFGAFISLFCEHFFFSYIYMFIFGVISVLESVVYVIVAKNVLLDGIVKSIDMLKPNYHLN